MIVGITGASGALYAVRALELMAQLGVETHLVLANAAKAVRRSARTTFARPY